MVYPFTEFLLLNFLVYPFTEFLRVSFYWFFFTEFLRVSFYLISFTEFLRVSFYWISLHVQSNEALDRGTPESEHIYQRPLSASLTSVHSSSAGGDNTQLISRKQTNHITQQVRGMGVHPSSYVIIILCYYYVSPSSGDVYRDRQLTPNFELWVEIFCVCVDMFPYEDSEILSVRTPRKGIALASSISVLH